MKQFLKFICFFIVIAEFSLLKVFSQQADAGPDTTICFGSKVKIGPVIYDPAWCFSWSPDDGTLSDIRSPEPIAKPAVTTTYTLKVVGPNFSFTSTDDMEVKIIKPKVTFMEYPDQKYGFDNYGVNSLLPWKSVKVGDNDILIVETKPSEDYKHIFIKSSNTGIMSLTPQKASSDKQEITLTGVSKGSTDLIVNGDDEDGYVLKNMNVATYDELSKTVTIILISEENDDETLIGLNKGRPDVAAIGGGANGLLDSYRAGDDEISGTYITTGSDGICQSIAAGDDVQNIPTNKGMPNQICIAPGPNNFRDTKEASGDDVIDGDNITTGPDGICNTVPNNQNILSTNVNDADAQDYLNKVYAQAAVSWTVMRLPVCVVNYDLDRNDSIDVKTWMSEEMRPIRDNCGNWLYDYNIFLVDKPNDGTYGFMDYGQSYGFVHADLSPGPHITISHELGHGAFGLMHTEPDSINIMYPYYSPDRLRLRKDQWDRINP
jgi:hypothetical protein